MRSNIDPPVADLRADTTPDRAGDAQTSLTTAITIDASSAAQRTAIVTTQTRGTGRS
jgi:hypothetical protein